MGKSNMGNKTKREIKFGYNSKNSYSAFTFI